jgi:hypothetical protein
MSRLLAFDSGSLQILVATVYARCLCLLILSFDPVFLSRPQLLLCARVQAAQAHKRRISPHVTQNTHNTLVAHQHIR